MNDLSRRFRWWAYGVLTTILAVVISVGLIILLGVTLIPPLIRVEPQEIVLPETVCPGEIVLQQVTLESQRPTVVDLDSGIYSVEARRIVPGSERSYSSPVPDDLNRIPLPIEFVVPMAEAGIYRMVVAITPRGRNTEIAFLDLTFEIGMGCEGGNAP